MIEYYSLPLKFGDLFKKKELSKCKDIGESISQNINLIITSRFGEYRFDPTFGCNIWEHDFENIFSNDDWSDYVSNSLKTIIGDHEPRIANVAVKADIIQEEVPSFPGSDTKSIKQKVIILVTGNLTSTNERFETTQKLYVSPLSFD